MKKLCKTCGKVGSMFSWEDECYYCRQKSYQSEIKRQITEGEADHTDCESEIYCPHCGEIYEIDDDNDLYEDGDHERECGQCEKPFKINVRVSYYYDTERLEG